MKKIGIILLTLVIALMCDIPAQAAINSVQLDVEYLENGDYIETVIVVEPSISRASTRTGRKTTTYKNSSGKAMWDVTVKGTFSYTVGKRSSCTTVSGSATSYSSNWKVSYSTSKSGNKAMCTGTGKHYSGSSLVGTYNKTVTLTCDKKGNLS